MHKTCKSETSLGKREVDLIRLKQKISKPVKNF